MIVTVNACEKHTQLANTQTFWTQNRDPAIHGVHGSGIETSTGPVHTTLNIVGPP
jgi:hypothetical protein